MSYIFISHFLYEELDCDSYYEEDEYKEIFTRSIRVITYGPSEDGYIETNGYGGNIYSSFFEWWIDPVEYPKLKVVYI